MNNRIVKYLIVFVIMSGFYLYSAMLAESRKTAISRAIEHVNPAVVGVNVTKTHRYLNSPFQDPLWNLLFPDRMAQRSVKSLGSGIIVNAEGIVYTNAHVVENSSEIEVTLSDGKTYSVVLIGIDELSDVAVLDIEGGNFPYAKLGNSDNIIVGEWAIAIGNPFGLFDIAHSPTATAGIVSALNLDFGKQESGRVYQNMIQTDASINSGNSGGPLVNANGEVIGMNTFIFTGSNYSQGSIGIGFAIPINRVKSIAEELMVYGKIDRSYETGISIQPVDRFLAQYLGLEKTEGVIITEIKHGSHGQRAGLAIGDVILQVDGAPVHSRSEVMNLIDEKFLRAGDSISLTIYRNGKILEKIVTLGKT
ncbi:trypsin-like peptidase domain-containing protein [bacterium]|nr:trypsin-like peptidase domain-containing protein [bacterium]